MTRREPGRAESSPKTEETPPSEEDDHEQQTRIRVVDRGRDDPCGVARHVDIVCRPAARVRWNQWKGTEVGEKFMSELKAAFEKDHPDITLVAVDAPFTGFHDRAIVQHQANKLAD